MLAADTPRIPENECWRRASEQCRPEGMHTKDHLRISARDISCAVQELCCNNFYRSGSAKLRKIANDALLYTVTIVQNKETRQIDRTQLYPLSGIKQVAGEAGLFSSLGLGRGLA